MLQKSGAFENGTGFGMSFGVNRIASRSLLPEGTWKWQVIRQGQVPLGKRDLLAARSDGALRLDGFVRDH